MAGYAAKSEYMLAPDPFDRMPGLRAWLVACYRYYGPLVRQKRNPCFLAEFRPGKVIGDSRAEYTLDPAMQYRRHTAPPVGMYENKQVRGDDQSCLFLYNGIEAEASLQFFAAQDRIEVQFVQVNCMNFGPVRPQAIADGARRCGVKAVV